MMGTLSLNGADPSTVRVKNVKPGSFAVHIQEWSYRDVSHTSEIISYMVIEAGFNVFPDGTPYEAGVSTIDGEFKRIMFKQPVNNAIVFAQITTDNNG
jgi:hypothetical protein